MRPGFRAALVLQELGTETQTIQADLGVLERVRQGVLHEVPDSRAPDRIIHPHLVKRDHLDGFGRAPAPNEGGQNQHKRHNS